MSERRAGELATFGGGCFWCLDQVFSDVVGVISVTAGYAGGPVVSPTYEQVTTGTTGHAEVVQIEFDPHTIQYEDLLEIFFSIHDPTTLNRQGADVGPQYRSIILFHNPKQEETAKRVIARLTEEGVFTDPIVTEIEPLTAFYPAETYHQSYFAKNPSQGYCRVVIAPKVAKFRKQNKYALRSNPP